MRVPRSTCRLQLTPTFDFANATGLLPHLATLGISDLYLSPIFEAVPGSAHGYDVTNPNSIRRELGGPEGFDRLAKACKRSGIGIILDIVPNHMSASHHNAWWYDVLKRGRASRFAEYFDIYWDDSPGGAVVLPVLGRSLDDVIDAGELTVHESDRGQEIAYFDHRFPLSDDSPGLLVGTPSIRDLREALRRQHYRLLYWRDGLRRLNYRRFFDIAGLVGVRVGEAEVFAATHSLIVDLVKSGDVSGLRVDHIDGLREPGRYLDRLRDSVAPAAPYVTVEKVLAFGEELPPSWAAAGTTGYEWLNSMNGVFVQPDGLQRLTDFRREFTGDTADFEEVSRQSRLTVMEQSFSAELNRLAVAGVSLAGSVGQPALQPEDFTTVVKVLTSRLRTYRTYVGDLNPEVGNSTSAASSLFEKFDGATDSQLAAMTVFEQALHGDVPPQAKPEAKSFIERWQQFSGMVMGKGVEDTAFYRYTALASMNEVGGEPGGKFASVQGLHELNTSNVEKGRLSLVTSSTHDTKWSEDARARLNVLSQLSDEWCDAVKHWSRLNRDLISIEAGQRSPTPDAELRFYQALAAVLPSSSNVPGDRFSAVAERLAVYMTKAAREAKIETSWLDSNERFEERLQNFVHDALVSQDGREFRSSFAPLADKLSFHGAVNSLGQVVLKVASPGVPDFYQGCEVWNLSLVDPDNRRPVHWSPLIEGLSELTSVHKDDWATKARDRYLDWPDGRIKQWVTWRALSLRNERPTLFSDGSYASLDVDGPMSNNVCAFERRSDGSRALAIATRMSMRAGATPEAVTSRETWNQTTVRLSDAGDRHFEDVLTGRSLVAESGRIEATHIFDVLPVALLIELGG